MNIFCEEIKNDTQLLDFIKYYKKNKNNLVECLINDLPIDFIFKNKYFTDNLFNRWYYYSEYNRETDSYIQDVTMESLLALSRFQLEILVKARLLELFKMNLTNIISNICAEECKYRCGMYMYFAEITMPYNFRDIITKNKDNIKELFDNQGDDVYIPCDDFIDLLLRLLLVDTIYDIETKIFHIISKRNEILKYRRNTLTKKYYKQLLDRLLPDSILMELGQYL
jgi:hypothetical protein